MSDYEFPFHHVSHLNILFLDDILPFDQYDFLTSLLPHPPSNESLNPTDLLDQELSYANFIPCNYIDLNYFS